MKLCTPTESNTRKGKGLRIVDHSTSKGLRVLVIHGSHLLSAILYSRFDVCMCMNNKEFFPVLILF